MGKIRIIRVAAGKHSTLGHLYIGDMFCCYTLEDTVRQHKIPGQTAIPAGTYHLALNPYAGMNGRYGNRYGAMHRGMVEIRGIPDFSLVFIHTGNTHADTAGCPLVGTHYQLLDGDYRLMQSIVAYKQVYPLLLAEMDRGNTGITIENRITS